MVDFSLYVEMEKLSVRPLRHFKTFGQALYLIWSGGGTGDYAIREIINRVKVFKEFQESKSIKPATSSSEGVFGGHLIGVKGGDSSVLFYR